MVWFALVWWWHPEVSSEGCQEMIGIAQPSFCATDFKSANPFSLPDIYVYIYLGLRMLAHHIINSLSPLSKDESNLSVCDSCVSPTLCTSGVSSGHLSSLAVTALT